MSVNALTVERWVGEGIIKCAHIVLSARLCRGSRTLPARSRSNWFKLEVEEVDDASQELSKYRHDVTRPLIIQILYSVEGDSPGQPAAAEVIEQWEMQFDGVPPTHQLRTISYDDEPTKIYKRMCVMARTLYSYVRVLPAYRLFRACRDNHGSSHNLSYRLLNTSAPPFPPSPAGSSASGPKHRMERFAFAPIATMTGSLQISVQYKSNVVPVISSAARPVSIPQHVITNYIRNQNRSDQMRALSASAAPVFYGSTNISSPAPPAPPAAAKGTGLLSQAYRAQAVAPQPRSSSSSGLKAVLSPHAEEAEAPKSSTTDSQAPTPKSTDADSASAATQGIDVPRCSTPAVPIHPSSAPSDFLLARHNPMPAFSPYTLHLAHHVKSQQHLPLPSPDETWRPLTVPRGPPDPPSLLHAALRRFSGSSSASGSSPPVGSPAEVAGAGRALVTSSRLGRVASGARQVLMMPSPESMLWGSPGFADGKGSRGRGVAEWPLRIEHSPSDQVTAQGSEEQWPWQGTGELASRHSGSAVGLLTSSRSQRQTSTSLGTRSPQEAAADVFQGRDATFSSGRSHNVHEMAVSAPELPTTDVEADVKEFLLQLETPVQFKSSCSQESCRTLQDVRATAEEIMARWGMS